MKTYLKRLFLFIVISFFTISCMQAKEPEVKEASMALDFKLQDLAQNTFSLTSYKDKQPVILFFWTTWCPFCRDELKTLSQTYPKLAKEGWELLAIDVGESVYKVDKFVKDNALTLKVLLDKDMAVAHSYDVMGVPTYILLDKKGYIVFKDNYFPQRQYKELISK